MEWSQFSPDLNPIENIWGLIKSKIYENGQSYNSLDELWAKIVKEAKSISNERIKSLIESVDRRLIKVLQKRADIQIIDRIHK